jgi:hypothetical protein
MIISDYDTMEDHNKQQNTTGAHTSPPKILALINFYWQKFLSRSSVIEQEEKILEKKLSTLESDIKLKKMREEINKLS